MIATGYVAERAWRKEVPIPAAVLSRSNTQPSGRFFVADLTSSGGDPLTPSTRRILAEQQAERFQSLASRWKAETAGLSSIDSKMNHPAMQEILAMRGDAVPLIISDLRKATSHWFVALRRLTGADPVPPHARGNVRAMRQAWLQWADQR